jgi:hypothetical protein
MGSMRSTRRSFSRRKGVSGKMAGLAGLAERARGLAVWLAVWRGRRMNWSAVGSKRIGEQTDDEEVGS